MPPHEAKPRVAAPDAAARPIEKTPVAGRSAELDVDDAIERAPAPEQSVAPISTGPPRRRPAATRGEPRSPIAEPVEASVTTSLPRLDGGPEPPRVTKTIDAVDDRPSPPADEIGETARHDVVAIEETTRANQREVHPAVPAVVTPDRAAPPEPHAPFIGAEAGPGAPTATPAPTEPRVHIGRLDVYVTAPEAPHRRPSTGADDLAQRLYLRGL
ncbi:MAG: hypothetical protein GY715_04060 [Planctomycetes bacterium]|nr:hypothetical protein [Planctomycetota bacterium]